MSKIPVRFYRKTLTKHNANFFNSPSKFLGRYFNEGLEGPIEISTRTNRHCHPPTSIDKRIYLLSRAEK